MPNISLTDIASRLAYPPTPDAIQPRMFFDMFSDPSLIVTILYTLEVAYWTLPLGYLLMPLINFFRVPNRRRMDGGQLAGQPLNVAANDLAELRSWWHDLLLDSASAVDGSEVSVDGKEVVRLARRRLQKLIRSDPQRGRLLNRLHDRLRVALDKYGDGRDLAKADLKWLNALWAQTASGKASVPNAFKGHFRSGAKINKRSPLFRL